MMETLTNACQSTVVGEMRWVRGEGQAAGKDCLTAAAARRSTRHREVETERPLQLGKMGTAKTMT
jgi:hypothetical protein